jgi:transposase
VEALLTNPDLPLPDDVPALQQLVRDLLAEVRRLRQENEELRHRLDQALRLHFGQRSERSRPRRARVPCDREERDEARSRPGHGRQPLPAHLPRQRVEYDLAEADRPCPCCGRPRVCIGEQVTEQLDYHPASYFVVQHVRKTWACRSCDGPSERRFATAGPAVVGPIPKGLPGPGLLAHLLTCKYADHLPLHRLEGIVARSGVRLTRSTLCDWMASAAALLGPLVALMRERLLLSRVVHSDDTSVPFLERGRDKAREGHLWVYIGDRDHPYVLFDFTTHYRRDGPEQFLKGYAGYLQADALAQYEGLFAGGKVLHAACNAHARRRFVEAQASAPGEAEEALKYIRKLYKIERELGERFAADDDAGRQQYRSAQTAAVRDEFHSWLVRQQAQALPKSPLGEAVGYALSNWRALMTPFGFLRPRPCSALSRSLPAQDNPSKSLTPHLTASLSKSLGRPERRASTPVRGTATGSEAPGLRPRLQGRRPGLENPVCIAEDRTPPSPKIRRSSALHPPGSVDYSGGCAVCTLDTETDREPST